MSYARFVAKLAALIGSDGKVPMTAMQYSGTFKTPAVRVNGGEGYSWADSLFSEVIKGSGDGGYRAAAFIGNAGVGASVWFGTTASPCAALDASNGGGMAFWANNGSSWRNVYTYNFDGAFVINSNGGSPSWSCPLVSGVEFHLHDQYIDRWKAYMNRAWDNYPSITVENDTRMGPQGEFRIHGGPGYSGADYSIYLRVDGGGNASDGRRKTDIVTIENALDLILKLRGVTYVGTNSDLEKQTHMSMANGRRFGFIAQELIPVAPEMVKDSGNAESERPNGWADQYAVDYASLTAVLVEAVKEQQAQIRQLQQRIKELESN